MSHPFFELPADKRDAARDAACEKYGVQDFYDLDPEQRAEAYDEAVRAAYSR